MIWHGGVNNQFFSSFALLFGTNFDILQIPTLAYSPIPCTLCLSLLLSPPSFSSSPWLLLTPSEWLSSWKTEHVCLCSLSCCRVLLVCMSTLFISNNKEVSNHMLDSYTAQIREQVEWPQSEWHVLTEAFWKETKQTPQISLSLSFCVFSLSLCPPLGCSYFSSTCWENLICILWV